MAKLKVRTIYDKDGIKIQADSYNWILLVKGKEPSYFGSIEYLFDSMLQERLKIRLKKNFQNLKQICNDLKKEVSEVGKALKNSSKRIIEH